MKITLEQYGNIYTFETKPNDLDRTDMLRAFYGLLNSAGYRVDDLMEGLE